MKEEFILPDYWYIKIEPDNIDLIQKWRKDKFNFTNDISSWNYIYYDGRERDGDVVRMVWGCLTTEQFKTHVYNEPSIPTNEDMNYLKEFLIKLNIK